MIKEKSVIMTTPEARCCTACEEPETRMEKKLQLCSRCKTALYCSCDCQKSDWKQHKLVCSTPEGSTNDKHSRGFHAVNQMFGLQQDNFLHTLSEDDTYAQLIDCFRMRLEDTYVFGCDNIGIYGGEDPRPAFAEFLDLAESRERILPPWWTAAKRAECQMRAVDESQWSGINYAVEKHDIQEHYGDTMMPLKLRVLGEKIYGKGFDR